MSNSLSEQLFKAGLISEQQLEKAQEPAPRYRPKPNAARKGGRDGRGPRAGGGERGGRREQAARGEGADTANRAAGTDGRPADAPRGRKKGKRRRGPARPPVVAAQAPTEDVQKLRSDSQRSRELLRDSRLAGDSAQVRRKREARERLEKRIAEIRQDVPEASIAFNFTRGKRIRRVLVTEEQRAKVVAGELAIAVLGADAYIIPSAARDGLRELAPDTFFHVGDAAAAESTSGGTQDGDEDDAYAGYEVPDDLVW